MNKRLQKISTSMFGFLNICRYLITLQTVVFPCMPFQICLFVCCFPLHSSFERALKLGHYETERDGGRESSVCCFLVPHAFYTSWNRNAPPLSYDLAHKGRAVCDMHHMFVDVSTYVCVAHVHTDASVFVASQKRRAARERVETVCWQCISVFGFIRFKRRVRCLPPGGRTEKTAHSFMVLKQIC